MHRPRLDDDERQQAYDVARRCWLEHEDTATNGLQEALHTRRTIKVKVRQHLASMGWEQILISLAIQFILPMIIKWIEKKFLNPDFSPPTAMPATFALEGGMDLDD